MTDINGVPEAEQRAHVVAVLRSWVRTPYHHAARLKGVGIDCATLIAEVYQEAGLVERVEIPGYSPQWHLHRKAEKYREFLLRYMHPITREQAGPGDVVLYKIGHVKAHGGIITERGWPFIIHAYSRAGFVIEADGTAGDLADKETEFFSYW